MAEALQEELPVDVLAWFRVDGGQGEGRDGAEELGCGEQQEEDSDPGRDGAGGGERDEERDAEQRGDGMSQDGPHRLMEAAK